jgi:hypothetical protein
MQNVLKQIAGLHPRLSYLVDLGPPDKFQTSYSCRWTEDHTLRTLDLEENQSAYSKIG